MIAIVAKQIIKKSALAEYDALVKELVEKSRQEEGNVSYVNVQDREDESIRIFLELWKDQDAIDIHNVTPHFTRIIPQLGVLFDGPEDVKLYDVKI